MTTIIFPIDRAKEEKAITEAYARLVPLYQGTIRKVPVKNVWRVKAVRILGNILEHR